MKSYNSNQHNSAKKSSWGDAAMTVDKSVGAGRCGIWTRIICRMQYKNKPDPIPFRKGYIGMSTSDPKIEYLI